MFSVVIPLYNKSRFIRRAVDSVLLQIHEDFELIVVDDGSTDNSLEILAEIVDSRLKVIRQTNSGVSAARNSGMREASRQWIAFLDADDYWFSDHLIELKCLIALFPDAGMVATSFIRGDEWAAKPPPQTHPNRRKIDYLHAASRDIGIVWSSDVALRRDVAIIVGGFASFSRGEDLHYWIRMSLTAPVAKSNRQTTYYYRNDQSIMATAEVEPLACNLSDIWPPIALFATMTSKSLSPNVRSGIRAWTRNAAFLTMLQNVMAGNVKNARAVAVQVALVPLDRATGLKLVVHLPVFLLTFAVRGYRGARYFVRRLRKLLV